MNENGLLFKAVKVTFVFMVVRHYVTRKVVERGGRDWQKQESRRCEVIKNNGYYAFHRSRASKYSVRTPFHYCTYI